MLKAVVHINFGDSERQGHGLRNVENILKGAQEETEIEVVAHGEGIALLLAEGKHVEQVKRLLQRHVKFAACNNTLQQKNIAADRLVPGVVVVPSGAVEVLRKQREGFGYFKP